VKSQSNQTEILFKIETWKRNQILRFKISTVEHGNAPRVDMRVSNEIQYVENIWNENTFCISFWQIIAISRNCSSPPQPVEGYCCAEKGEQAL